MYSLRPGSQADRVVNGIISVYPRLGARRRDGDSATPVLRLWSSLLVEDELLDVQVHIVYIRDERQLVESAEPTFLEGRGHGGGRAQETFRDRMWRDVPLMTAGLLADATWQAELVELVELASDVVARKGVELLVGEVKSRNSPKLGDLNWLADAVAAVPHARRPRR
jgi:hypothetical protein